MSTDPAEDLGYGPLGTPGADVDLGPGWLPPGHAEAAERARERER